MPSVPTYIRQSDYDKYAAIAQTKGAWTEFIHNALIAGDLGKTLYKMPMGKDLARELSELDIDDGVNEVILTPEQTEAYENMSGFKTTGEVKVYKNSDKVQSLVDDLLDPTITPPEDSA